MSSSVKPISRRTRFIRNGCINLLVLLVLLLLIEGTLRVALDAPQGYFKLWFSGRLGLYPENARQVNFGRTNWMITTNSYGFRSDEIQKEKIPGKLRIAMLGDSITDGFGVENEYTYPANVQAALKRAGVDNEVINGGNGGATIDRELAILRDAMTPFHPDVAVLTFVTNDINSLAAVSDDALLNSRADWDTPQRRFMRFMLVYTALGETVVNQTLRQLSPDFARSQDAPAPELQADPDRYHIPGGDHFEENAREFSRISANADGRILQDVFDAETEHQIQRYLQALDAFVAHCRASGMVPVFVYYPSYSQVYDLSVSLKIRDLLQEHNKVAGVPFLDLTPVMREKGAGRVLHLAPRDYVHLNPDGNAVIGGALAAFLIQEGLANPATDN